MNIFSNYQSVLLSQAKLTPEIFWDIDKDAINQLSKEALLERLLNFGNWDQLKAVTRNKKQFKKIYQEIRKKQRCNLRPEVSNYIDLYLSKYA